MPVLLKDVYQPRGEFTKARAAFCIHNIAFQGRFFEQDYADTGLPFTSIERFKFEDGIPKVFNEKSPAIEGEKIPAVAGACPCAAPLRPPHLASLHQPSGSQPPGSRPAVAASPLPPPSSLDSG